MSLVDYVSKTGEKVGEFGSRIYDVASASKKAVNTGLVGLAMCGLVATSGCLSTYGKMAARDLAYTGMQQAVVSGVRSELEGRRDGQRVVERSSNTRRRDNQREVGNNRGDVANGNRGVQYVRERELVVQYYKDFNGNRILDTGEILGDVEESVNLDRYGLLVGLGTSSPLPIIYFVLDSNENKVSQGRSEGERVGWGYITSSNVFAGDWIDNLNGASKERPGEYTIYVQQDGCSKIFKKKINITRDSMGSSSEQSFNESFIRDNPVESFINESSIW
ncbi:hypothetical protein KAT36_01645 [Candidatus Pacearchaeota archaeon]|nr:hypothetical protein [Candidatus Pacearchaeota archaeon]